MREPSEIEIRVLDAACRGVLDDVADDVFDEPVDERWSAEFLADPRHHLAAALDAGRVVGFASGVHYVHPDKAPELWINEVGVAPDYQRRGLGKALIEALIAHGRALGCGEAWVLTEEDNVAARALYAAAGGREQERPVYVTFELEGGE
jgi:ribosomal protein S18 acetylase RimI-like enzyme